MQAQDFLKKFEKETVALLEDFKKEIIKIRTSRPSPELVEDILVEAYDRRMPLKQLASISVVPPNAIFLEVWDKNLIPAIKNALNRSQLGLNPVEENNQLKLYLPSLTQERRKELIQLVLKIKENTRIKVRQLRDEILKEIKKSYEEKVISEDEMFSLKKKIDDEVEKFNKSLDELEKKKVEEINNS